jgi:hypothetical protein
VIECVAAVSALVLHCAVRVLAEPVSATTPQPEIDAAPSVKLIVPVRLYPVTDAVNVTLVPAANGLAELASAAEVEAGFTISVSVLLVEPVLVASPL